MGHHHHMFQQHTRLPLTLQRLHTPPNTLPSTPPSTLPNTHQSQHTNQHTSQHTSQQQSTPPSTLHQRSTHQNQHINQQQSTLHQSRTMVNQHTTMDTLSTQVQSQPTINTVHGPRTDTPINTTNTTQVTAKRVHVMPNTLPDALVTCSTPFIPNSAKPITPKLSFSKSPKISSVLVKKPKTTGVLNATILMLNQMPVHKDVNHSSISPVKISCQQNPPMQDTITMIMADAREEIQQLKEQSVDHVTSLLVTSNVKTWISIQQTLHNNLSLRSKNWLMLLHQNVTKHGETQ